jgi:GxxExxY protein
MAELLYKEEVYQIIGAAMEVYNQIGNGFLEGVYQDALGLELANAKNSLQGTSLPEITYKGQPLRHHYHPDMVLFDKIILELKAISSLGSQRRSSIAELPQSLWPAPGFVDQLSARKKRLDYKTTNKHEVR